MSENPILAVIASIVDAVKLVDVSQMEYVDELLVQNVMGEEIEPPAVVIGPPSLDFEGFSRAPSASELVVYVIVDKTDEMRALEQLYQLVPAVVESIEEHVQGAAVESAKPGTFPVGARELPAYGIAVSINL